jgi:hypothetical protein
MLVHRMPYRSSKYPYSPCNLSQLASSDIGKQVVLTCKTTTKNININTMKKILIAAAILFSTSSFASTNNDLTNKSIIKKVLVEEQKVSEFYNQKGELIGTTRYQDFDKLPKNAIKTITSKYTFPLYSLQECIAFTDGYNDLTYYVSMTTDTEYMVLAISEYGEVSIFSNTRR